MSPFFVMEWRASSPVLESKGFPQGLRANGLFVPFPPFGKNCKVVREQYSGEGCSN